ncbi:Urease operon transcriptional activator [Pseudomonas sp. 31 R 17]|uniref:AraC family transcriptional regulator n=4 Tax=Pseudomonas TaxID=286 RepID=A0ACD4XRE0_PSEFL|nr:MULTISPECIES: AraC family transcriptional regulator [Pseudomonas]MBV4510214.1 AraC family transcriptional regulator [Pseudomonas sp. SWRI22]MBZ6459609.1 AraC family transcriptional regulator [Pseudomonas fluorescens group sp.]MBZ6465614.1 AraC family transcriptional regulator [Pseudomonas fluorescens group sp.]MBZ6471628.1 AraC family transcriptional regulator [Pseudomonas fluorescens group sp.]MDY4301577.1 AraC family transcriptional regulator [Pseudomonas salmasensis]
MSFRNFLRGPTSTLLMVEFGDEKGFRAEKILLGSGLTLAQLTDPNLELTADQELRVAENLLRLSGHAAGLGFEVGTRYHFSTYGLFGYGLISSATVGDALALALRFLPLTYAFTVVAYEEQGDEGVLTFAVLGLAPDLREFLLTRDMSAAALLLKELGGNDFSLSRFCLSKQPPPIPDNVKVLGCAPSYAANSNSLAFNRSFLSLPLPQANAVTVSMCEQMCTQLMQRRIAHAGMTALVQHYLNTPDNGMPDLSSISELLHVSPRTLKRRLKEEGTTFRKLLADVRSRNAINLLKDGHNLTEIAERLGFSDLSSFSQAFKRWHGISPSQFSQQKNNFGNY